jgi:hypothetical protein
MYGSPGVLFAQDPLTLEVISGGSRTTISGFKVLVDIARNNNTPGQAGRYPTINLLLNSTNNMVNRVRQPFAVPVQIFQTAFSRRLTSAG